MPEEKDRRIEQLESNFAYLELQLEQLNTVVMEQGKLLDRMKKEVHRHTIIMETLELDRIKDNNTKPPHYQ